MNANMKFWQMAGVEVPGELLAATTEEERYQACHKMLKSIGAVMSRWPNHPKGFTYTVTTSDGKFHQFKTIKSFEGFAITRVGRSA